MDRISRSVIDLEDFFNITKKYDCGIEFLLFSIHEKRRDGAQPQKDSAINIGDWGLNPQQDFLHVWGHMHCLLCCFAA